MSAELSNEAPAAQGVSITISLYAFILLFMGLAAVFGLLINVFTTAPGNPSKLLLNSSQEAAVVVAAESESVESVDFVESVDSVESVKSARLPRALHLGALAKVDEVLTPRLVAALDYIARRYRVSADALRPIFQAAQLIGRETNLDPLLIVAIIGIESSFNPFSESAMGALGLMQVMPNYHQDKLPAGAGKVHFLDPLINVRVGTHVLQESITRNGGLIAGLQQFAGAVDDETQSYATKVLAEKQRLEQAGQRKSTIASTSS
jgi:hypothetical protein